MRKRRFRPGVDDHQIKKTKFNELLFTNDYIQLILSFIDQDFIFRTCSLISKQFREQTINTPVALHIEKKEHLDRIRNLINPLNITELDMKSEVGFDVLDWIFHHPPKFLKKLSIKINMQKIATDASRDEQVEKLCRIPALCTLTSLHIGENIMANKGCSLIANCEYFQNLTELSVDEFKCDEKGIELIVRSKYMSNLTQLGFRRHTLTRVECILSSPLFLRVKILELSYCLIEKLMFPQVMPLLEDLNLEGNMLQPNGLMALTQTRNLTRLNLCENGFDDEGCKILSENQYLSKLTDLYINANEITTKGLKHIVSSPYFKQLKLLNLEDTLIDNEGCKILAESENMRNLTSLTLGKEQTAEEEEFITMDGLSVLFNSTNMSNLKALSLNNLDLMDNNFGFTLLNSSFGKNLTSFNIYQCELDTIDVQYIAQLNGLRQLNITTYDSIDKACECIASSSHMSNLTSLTLACEINDSGCSALANSIYLIRLTVLNLSSNRIGNDGCEYLAYSDNFINLTTLDLTMTWILKD